MFVTQELDGEALLSLTRIRKGKFIRAAGEYFEDEGIPKYVAGEDSDSLASTSKHIATSLLCSGVRVSQWAGFSNLGRDSQTPSRYQLLPLDLLNTPWLDSLISARFPRSRLIIADEGGLGKTLATSLSIANTFFENRGVIIVLCPVRLRSKWAKQIRNCMRGESHAVKEITARDHSMSSKMNDGVYVISKHSIMHRWMEYPHSRDWMPDCELVVIDEAHQGKRRSSEEGPPSSINKNDPLWESQHQLCSKSKRVISLTASPIRTETDDIITIFRMMGGEAIEFADGMEQVFSETGWEDTFKEVNKSLTEALEIVGGSMDDAKDWVTNFSGFLEPMLDWMEPAVRDEILNSFLQNGPETISNNQGLQGFRLLRDLHPFGRFFSVVRRCDMGMDAQRMFRDRKDEFHRIEIHPDHQKVIDDIGGESTWIALSWVENITSGRYESIETGMSPPDPKKDPRWIFVLEQIKQELCELKQGSERGVVIFVNYIGTVEGMERQLEEEFRDPAIQVFTLSSEEDGDSILANAAKSSSSGKLPILVCTSAVEIGLDMEWATVGIMWDINSNPETLSQRTWRLDRRKDENSTKEDFRIIHIQNKANEIFLQRMNKSHLESSSILGIPEPHFIPMVQAGDPKKFDREWPSESGVFALLDDEAKEIAIRTGVSQEEDLLKGASYHFENQSNLDILFWSHLSSLTGLEIDDELLMEGLISLNDNCFEQESQESALRPEQLRLIWTLSNFSSITEMSMLWRLSSNGIKVANEEFGKQKFNLRYSQGEDNQFGPCLINREGNLSSKLRTLILRSAREQGLLSTGAGAPFLARVDRLEPYGAKALAVNIEWLELFSKHRRILQSPSTFSKPVCSPIITIDEPEEFPGEVEFLELSDDYNYTLENAIDFSLRPNEGSRKYFGSFIEESWPEISQESVYSIGIKAHSLAQRLREELIERAQVNGKFNASQESLFKDLTIFLKDEPRDSDVVPLFRLGDY